MSGYLGASAAAVLYGCGLAVLFVIRSRRHKAATGSSGLNGFTRTPGAAAPLFTFDTRRIPRKLLTVRRRSLMTNL